MALVACLAYTSALKMKVVMFLQNVVELVPDCMASQPRQPYLLIYFQGVVLFSEIKFILH
jgi:hypothetical protein